MANITFGPIVSRRFGISLGVDLSPYQKQCNFDCLYCELKPKKAISYYDEIVPLDELVNSVKTALKQHTNIDVLTITANGEPTLYPYLDEFITAIKPYIPANTKSLILSNGSLFGEVAIQKALKKFDIVKFSLDSGDAKSFKKVDRPHKNLDLESIKNGIRSFAISRDNILVCEILIVKGINDDFHSMLPLVEFLKEINVDRIDLSTIDRPPAYNVESISYDKLCEISELFSGLFVSIPKRKFYDVSNLLDLCESEIIDLLKKRPLDTNEATYLLTQKSLGILTLLLEKKAIKQKRIGLIDFYTL